MANCSCWCHLPGCSVIPGDGEPHLCCGAEEIPATAPDAGTSGPRVSAASPLAVEKARKASPAGYREKIEKHARDTRRGQ